MKLYSIWLFLFLFVLIGCTAPVSDHQLIDITDVNNSILLDIRYATTNNFLNEAVYAEAKCFLVKEAAYKLDSIQVELEKVGLGLKIFDGYRPHSVTRKMWQILPDARYVANPQNGSRHNRGAAVDLTLVDSSGTELEMPTEFDDFTERAGHEFMDLPEHVLKNRALLKNIMERHGFLSLKSEWWHYDLKNYEQYPILDMTFSEIKP
jgi:D-alanyl-D-alanine dipeptidase